MNVYVKVFHYADNGLSYRVFDVCVPDATSDNPVEVATVQTRDGYVEAVDALGKTTVLDSLEDAERVIVGSRVIWPESAVKYAS